MSNSPTTLAKRGISAAERGGHLTNIAKDVDSSATTGPNHPPATEVPKPEATGEPLTETAAEMAAEEIGPGDPDPDENPLTTLDPVGDAMPDGPIGDDPDAGPSVLGPDGPEGPDMIGPSPVEDFLRGDQPARSTSDQEGSDT